MNNCTHLHTKHQEYFGWIGNCIFITAQLAQMLHTYKVKKTGDVSYILEILWIIGNAMYTTFGYIDNSESMFYGNLVSLIISVIQITQKIYYDRLNKNNLYLLEPYGAGSYTEIN
jgi:uncharacterized protein with PQ loop repeat